MDHLRRALLVLALLPPLVAFAATQQVVVYSFVTDAGRHLAWPAAAHPARFALGSGGYHEWGGVRAGEKPMQLAEIEPLVRAALGVNAYEGLRPGEDPDLVIEFYWGCMRPDATGVSRRGYGAVVNLPDLLDLVGGRVLESTSNRILRDAVIEAALEERYFLILSAFAPGEYARKRKILLWRTQISVPISALTQKQCFPILAACGAPHFGRMTPEPRFIDVDVEGTLRAVTRQIW